MPDHHGLFSADDPPPVELIAANRPAPIVLACEHAGRTVPRKLAGNTPQDIDMARHIAMDIGAEQVAHQLANYLDVPLVIQRYSRLVIDCNRPRTAPDLCPQQADGTYIGFNKNLFPAEIKQRWQAIHQPFHRVLADSFNHHPSAFLVTIHSFTPRLDGIDRPWHIGFLARHDLRLAGFLQKYFATAWPDIITALNQPYKIETESDYTIPVHGETAGKHHVLVEIRNDLIDDSDKSRVWADRLAAGLLGFVTKLAGE